MGVTRADLCASLGAVVQFAESVGEDEGKGGKGERRVVPTGRFAYQWKSLNDVSHGRSLTRSKERLGCSRMARAC